MLYEFLFIIQILIFIILFSIFNNTFLKTTKILQYLNHLFKLRMLDINIDSINISYNNKLGLVKL